MLFCPKFGDDFLGFLFVDFNKFFERFYHCALGFDSFHDLFLDGEGQNRNFYFSKLFQSFLVPLL